MSRLVVALALVELEYVVTNDRAFRDSVLLPRFDFPHGD
jgi:hypothetical protein